MMKKLFTPLILIMIIFLMGSECSSPTETEKPPSNNQNFTWRTDTLGKAGSSVGDVWVVNENDIYVVGQFNREDYNSYLPNNLAHWDGQKWEMRRVYFVRTFDQGIDSSINKIYTFRYFDKNNTLVSDGGEIAIWNGVELLTKFPPRDYLKGNMIHSYGTSSTDLFYGGTNYQENIGSLVHFNGESFENIETGSSLPVQDIFGRGSVAFLVASDFWSGFEPTDIAKINLESKQVELQSQDSLVGPIASCWISPDNQQIYVGGSNRIYKRAVSGNSYWSEMKTPIDQAIIKIRGNAENDLFVVGGYNMVYHYNGENWLNLTELIPDRIIGGNYEVLSVSQKTTAMAGDAEFGAYVTLAKRKE